jgi:hypothetical protein
MKPLAVYTTLYPGVEPYLPDWFSSLKAQTDREFQLWIGLDAVSPQLVTEILGSHLNAKLIPAESGDTPAGIRQRCLAQIVKECDAVISVDSDDILEPPRVAAARQGLESSDLVACALKLIDQEGRDLNLELGLPLAGTVEDVLPRNNVFGLSNSAYRSELLQRCLPIPAGVVLVDWFLASKAWLLGARLAFDPAPRMKYRQYQRNIARVRYPASPEQVILDTVLVRRHLQFLLSLNPAGFLSERIGLLKSVASDVEIFHNRIIQRPRQLQRYVEQLNILNPPPLWWSSVANPALECMWQTAPCHEYC